MIHNDALPSEGDYLQANRFFLAQIPKKYKLPIYKGKLVINKQSDFWQETFRENAENTLLSIAKKVQKSDWQQKNLTHLHKEVLNVRNCLGKTTRSFLLIMNRIEPLMEQAEKTASKTTDQEVILHT